MLLDILAYNFIIFTEVEIVILLFQCIPSTVQSVSMPSSATTENDTKKLGKKKERNRENKIHIYMHIYCIIYFSFFLGFYFKRQNALRISNYSS